MNIQYPRPTVYAGLAALRGPAALARQAAPMRLPALAPLAAWRRLAALTLLAALGLMPCAAGAASATSYTADAAKSRLEFTGVQAGAEFKAVFHRFDAVIDFSPDALAAAHFDVTIDVNSVDSQDKDRDSTMRGADIFDVAHWPSAHYVTKSFVKTAAGFTAAGTLTLRGVAKDVPVDFIFTQTADGAKLDGTAKLQRLDFGVGQGDWKNTEWIGNVVKIRFALVLTPKH